MVFFVPGLPVLAASSLLAVHYPSHQWRPLHLNGTLQLKGYAFMIANLLLPYLQGQVLRASFIRAFVMASGWDYLLISYFIFYSKPWVIFAGLWLFSTYFGGWVGAHILVGGWLAVACWVFSISAGQLHIHCPRPHPPLRCRHSGRMLLAGQVRSLVAKCRTRQRQLAAAAAAEGGSAALQPPPPLHVLLAARLCGVMGGSGATAWLWPMWGPPPGCCGLEAKKAT